MSEHNSHPSVLLPEIWNKILLHLWQLEDDQDTLKICRLAYSSWGELLDKMPPRLQWNPWLDMAASTVWATPATRFRSDVDVEQFVESIANLDPDDAKKNPFHNNSVKLFELQHATSVKGREKIVKVFNQHGHHLHQLFFTYPLLDKKSTDPVSRFPPLFPNMVNLRAITFNITCMRNLDKDSFPITEHFPKHLTNLHHLMIFGDHFGYCDSVDRSALICETFSKHDGNQIKRISLEHWHLDTDRLRRQKPYMALYRGFPNLEEFRVEEIRVYDQASLQYGNVWPKLKRLVLGMKMSEGSREFQLVVNVFIPYFSATLQILSLAFLQSIEGDPNRSTLPPKTTKTTFPKLEKLYIPYRVIYSKNRRTHESQINRIPIEQRLNYKLPILKHVVIEDTMDEFTYQSVTQVDVDAICSPMWSLLPPTVETISLRVLDTMSLHNNSFPFLFTCNRA